MKFPESILSQHIAVLGKTGSGKTSTSKLIAEQVHAGEARICILDPIKSDWWGITSSSDGKRPGLAFDILGGPHGHVPLHAAAGAPIGQLVGSGALRSSVIDMADFMPGEHAKFFIAFAQALFKHARGVLYLFVEEAHIFAPKEMAGFGEEAKSIHWMSKLATGARSKGLRLVVATQRTQKLHNDVLGSCDTMIVHRLTAPADQQPVIKWLKANTDPETTKTIAGSLSSLATGEGWICSGEAKILERVKFPRIKTYDNTATPTGDGDDHKVRTAPVDQDRLKSIIGEAVQEAEANDPKKLREQVAKLKRELDAASKNVKPAVAGKPIIDTAAIERAVMKAISERDRFWVQRTTKAIRKINGMGQHLADYGKQIAEVQEDLRIDLTDPAYNAPMSRPVPAPRILPANTASLTPVAVELRNPKSEVGDGTIDKPTQKILNSLAWWRAVGVDEPTVAQCAAIAGYAASGSFDTYLSRAGTRGILRRERGRITLLDESLAPAVDAPATLDELHARVLQTLDGPSVKIITALISHQGQALTVADLAAASGYAASGSFDTYLSRLGTRGFIVRARGQVTPTEVLFPASLL